MYDQTGRECVNKNWCVTLLLPVTFQKRSILDMNFSICDLSLKKIKKRAVLGTKTSDTPQDALIKTLINSLVVNALDLLIRIHAPKPASSVLTVEVSIG